MQWSFGWEGSSRPKFGSCYNLDNRGGKSRQDRGAYVALPCLSRLITVLPGHWASQEVPKRLAGRTWPANNSLSTPEPLLPQGQWTAPRSGSQGAREPGELWCEVRKWVWGEEKQLLSHGEAENSSTGDWIRKDTWYPTDFRSFTLLH